MDRETDASLQSPVLATLQLPSRSTLPLSCDTAGESRYPASDAVSSGLGGV